MEARGGGGRVSMDMNMEQLCVGEIRGGKEGRSAKVPEFRNVSQVLVMLKGPGSTGAIGFFFGPPSHK